MTWRLFWELLALFVVVVGAKNKANWSWYHGRLGSFIFWAVVIGRSYCWHGGSGQIGGKRDE